MLNVRSIIVTLQKFLKKKQNLIAPSVFVRVQYEAGYWLTKSCVEIRYKYCIQALLQS